jgi:phage terminase Nu1 subunit (DNA packaging protein)
VSFVNQSELASEAGVSRQIISRYVKQGKIKTREDGGINLNEGLQVLSKIKTKGSNGNGNDKDKKRSLWEEQARLAGHKADIAEMESRKLAKELVEVDLVVAEFGKLVTAVRQRLLGLGSRLAPQLSKKPPAFIKRKLDTAIDEVLNEFGKYNAETGECGPVKSAHTNRKSGWNVKAKGPANRKPVGKQI